MATKSAIDGPGGPVVAGDHLRRDSAQASFVTVNILGLALRLALLWLICQG